MLLGRVVEGLGEGLTAPFDCLSTPSGMGDCREGSFALVAACLQRETLTPALCLQSTPKRIVMHGRSHVLCQTCHVPVHNSFMRTLNRLVYIVVLNKSFSHQLLQTKGHGYTHIHTTSTLTYTNHARRKCTEYKTRPCYDGLWQYTRPTD